MKHLYSCCFKSRGYTEQELILKETKGEVVKAASEIIFQKAQSHMHVSTVVLASNSNSDSYARLHLLHIHWLPWLQGYEKYILI